jgi:hypothetical protein
LKKEAEESVSIVSLSKQGFSQGVQLKLSARSALTEGSDSLTLVLVHPEVKLGYRSHAGSAQAKESLSCESEWNVEGLLLQECAESKVFNTWRCLRVAARSARKSLF